MCHALLRIKFDGAAAACESSLQQSQLPLRIGEIAVDVSIVGLEPEGELVGAGCRVAVTERQVCIAEVVVRLGRLRVVLQRLPV